MVCDRCKWVVKTEIEKLGFKANVIDLGEIELETDIEPDQKKQIKEALEKFGFELIDDKKSRIIEKIKALLIDVTQNKNADLSKNLSLYIAEHLNQDLPFSLIVCPTNSTIRLMLVCLKLVYVLGYINLPNDSV